MKKEDKTVGTRQTSKNGRGVEDTNRRATVKVKVNRNLSSVWSKLNRSLSRTGVYPLCRKS